MMTMNIANWAMEMDKSSVVGGAPALAEDEVNHNGKKRTMPSLNNLKKMSGNNSIQINHANHSDQSANKFNRRKYANHDTSRRR